MNITAEGAPWRIRALRAFLRRLPRGRYSVLAAIAPSHGQFTSHLAGDAGGASFACDLGDQISREVCLTGLYEPPVTRVVQHHLRPGGIVVDVGANWGYFTLLAAPAVGPQGTVFALEPDPRQFEALSRNVSANGFRQVSSLQAAASAAEGRLSLVGYDEGQANRGVSRVARPQTNTDQHRPPDHGPSEAGQRFDVRATTVDLLTAACPQVDIVKIDVEGAEDTVLEGMHAGLSARRYRALVLELHPDLLRARRVDPASCVARMREYGYRGWTIDLGPDTYRRALDPSVDVDSLLRPLDSWRDTPWPHLLWLC